MQEISVATDAERRARLSDFAGDDADQKARNGAAKRTNVDFTQVTPKGWARVEDLIDKNPAAAKTFVFLARHVNGQENAVVCSQQLIADETKTSLSTVKRHLDFLENVGAIVRLKIQGGACAYCLDPQEIWRYWANAKKYAAFNTRTLVSKRENKLADRQMRLLFGHETPDEADQA